MTRHDDVPALVAQVVLRAASGRTTARGTAITTANLSEHVPSPESFEAVGRGFSELGFVVGPALGVSLSISGERAMFERCFRVELPVDLQESELPLEALPPQLAERIEHIVFEPPAIHLGDTSGP